MMTLTRCAGRARGVGRALGCWRWGFSGINYDGNARMWTYPNGEQQELGKRPFGQMVVCEVMR